MAIGLRALTWRTGPPRRCDAALRPRGRARVARAVRRWRTRRGHVAGGHVVHAGHADTPEGCHVAYGGLAMGGPTGIVGPW